MVEINLMSVSVLNPKIADCRLQRQQKKTIESCDMLESTDMHLESLDEPDSLLRRFCLYRKKLIV